MTDRLTDRPTDQLIASARTGDERAFRLLTESYQHELRVHCYRMLGSLHDAEDVLQETWLAAWRGLDGFEGRASPRAWLYKIATNRCLNAVRDASRRPKPPEPPFQPPEPTRMAEPMWLEPYPDALIDGRADAVPGPEARYETRETIELAFIVALQQLPARQRAVLVLRDVLGFRTAEAAELLEISEPAVKAALQRARDTLRAQDPADHGSAPAPDSPRERDLARRFAEAFEADDIDGVIALLTEDARLWMPPSPLEYQGRTAIAAFLRTSANWRAGRRFRLEPTRANAQPAFGLYVQADDASTTHPAGLIVLTLDEDRIRGITRFLDESVMTSFDLPARSHR